MYEQPSSQKELWQQYIAGFLSDEQYLEALEERLSWDIDDAEEEADSEISTIKYDLKVAIKRLEERLEADIKAFKNREIHPDQGSFLEEVS